MVNLNLRLDPAIKRLDGSLFHVQFATTLGVWTGEKIPGMTILSEVKLLCYEAVPALPPIGSFLSGMEVKYIEMVPYDNDTMIYRVWLDWFTNRPFYAGDDGPMDCLSSDSDLRERVSMMLEHGWQVVSTETPFNDLLGQGIKLGVPRDRADAEDEG